MSYSKNQIVTVKIEDMGENSEGIGRIDGYTLFVKDALIGDEIQAKLTKVKKNYAYARIEKVLTPSENRIEPLCRYHRQCGGCQIQALSYEEQLRYKEQKVKNHLMRIGGFAKPLLDAITEPIIGMEEGSDFRYRNKAQFPIGTNKEGELITGFYAGRTHSIIANTDCFLGDVVNEPILKVILAHMKEHHIPAYDETTQKGLVRHVLIRVGRVTREVMVSIVINGKKYPEWESLCEELRETISKKSYSLEHLSLSVNKKNTNVIMGEEIKLLYGKPAIEDVLCGLTFSISPLSFYQVNPVQAERLYQTALEYASLTGREAVWDLYCGIGTISLCLARAAGQVYGVEIIPDAIRDAKENAIRNGVANAQFFVGKAEEVLPAFYEGKLKYECGNDRCFESETEDALGGESDLLHPDVIVVDPPRKGCDEKCLETMVKMMPDRIVYVSCDSATLARDAKYLCENGYELKRVRTCDMFPQTSHVETIVLLSWKGIDDFMYVDYAPDHHVIQGGKATYKEITEWIQETYGAHVTNLNIAQVKDKCGFEKRENYNKGTEGHRVPNCTPEKEQMIMSAFKHFNML